MCRAARFSVALMASPAAMRRRKPARSRASASLTSSASVSAVEALLGEVGEQFAAAEAEAREALRVVGEELVEMPPCQRVALGGEGLPFRGLGERRHDLA
jgi:hypothetical protein